MPWNCLCSNTSKKEKRPQISAPILQIDESKKKPQIQPARVINTEALEQRLLDVESPDTISPCSDTVDHAPVCETGKDLKEQECENQKGKGKSNKKKAKENKKLAKKLKKEEKARKKKQEKLSNKKNKAGKNKQETGSKSFDTKRDNEKLEKQFTHVQFSFDDYSGLDLTEQTPYQEATPPPDPPLSVPPQKPARGEIIQIHKNDENGNYDELPLIQINDEPTQPPEPVTTSLSRSSESIPFIDDEAQSRSPSRQLYHDTRIITLIPKNLESHHLQCNPSHLQTFAPVTKLRYEPQLQQIKPVHILPKIDEQGGQENGLHKFQYYYTPGYKICQICHLYLHVCPAIKCFECEFTCHQECFHKPKLRYADTSYLIYQQWRKGGPVQTFPLLTKYYVDENGVNIRNNKKDKKLSKQSNNNNNNKAVYKIRDSLGKDKSVNGGNKNGKNYKKRRSRKSASDSDDNNTNNKENITKENSLPPPPPPPPLQENVNEITEYNQTIPLPLLPSPPPPELSTFKSPPTSPIVAKIEEVDQFDTQLRIDEPRNTISSVDEVKEIEVSADIHRSNSESEEDTVIEANNNCLKLDRQLIADTELVIKETEDLERKPLFGASMSVPIQRKQYDPVDIDALSSVSDLEDAESLIRQLQYGVEQVKNSYNDEEQQIIPKSRSFPVSSQHTHKTSNNSASNALRLHYITERILASVLPGRTHAEVTQRRLSKQQNGHYSDRGTTTGDEFEDEYERELILMLEQKHGKNYRVFDLESCLAVITLEKLCELCKHIDSWLGSARERVVVLQDRGDRQRLGSAIAAYLEYQRICGSNYSPNKVTTLSSEDSRMQHQIVRNWLDLDIFSMRKFLEDMVGPLHVPSYKRYIAYFAGLLSGEIKMNSAALHLNYVILESPPCLHYKAVTTADNEWKSFIKIYEGKRCVFISDVYIIPITTKQFIYEIKHPLRLRGDIIVRCFQLIPNNTRYSDRELISSVQFHTCAITSTEVVFNKFDLDYAYDDERFPNDHKITLIFINAATPPNNDLNRQLVFQNPLVRVEPLSNCSSLDNISEASSQHTHGPVDGSLYATILKSPKSLQTSPVKPLRTSTQSLISPPAEFSNHAKYSVDTPDTSKFHVAHHPLSTSTPQVHTYGKSADAGHYEDIKVIQEQQRTSARNTPTPSVVSYSSRHSVRTTNQHNGYNGHVPDGSGGYATVGQASQQQQQQQQSGEQREFVRSPLTLSMDSGISSSGVVNRGGRGVQGGASSVSPVSFPSQASPQEDRHRELDDLLSDMLMTVQDIPDIQTTQAKLKSSSSQQVLSKGIAPIPTASSSTSSVTTVVTQKSTTSASGAQQSSLLRDRELYENSSTTTLTPPPSENGRETPTNVQLRTKRDLEQQERDLIMSLSGATNELYVNEQQQTTNGNNNAGDTLLKMNLQHHSYLYPQQARIETLSISDTDDDQQSNIPYHAREDSRPFTYGNIPPPNSGRTTPLNTQGTMLKSQSGLSSPSMVRKVIIADKKSQQQKPRNEFEDMLMERREKIMSEKYSIGDKTPNGTAATNGYDSKWYHTTQTTSQTNGYPYDLLKRSNTMDGSFRRGNDNIDGISGQTWLQLQQQKLRAKREAQGRDFTDNFSRSYGSPISFNDTIHHSSRRSQTLSPVRNERNYHTISKTNSYSTNERPFVAVKRAHEQARHGYNSAPQSPLTVLNASPHGQISHVNNSNTSPGKVRTVQNGLIKFEDELVNSPRSPSRNGHVGFNGVEPDLNHHHNHHHHHNQTNQIINNKCHNQTNINNNANNNNNSNNNNNHNNYKSTSPLNANNNGVASLDNNKNYLQVVNNGIIDTPESIRKTNVELSHEVINGQLALDQLLASLALESDVTEQHLANLENGNHIEENPNKSGKRTNELTAVIATLTEFGNSIQNTSEIITNWHLTRNTEINGNSLVHNAIKRVHDIGSSECSSSISPSLSERSTNGVSWSDQAREESFSSSYRSDVENEMSPRPETPAFPVTPRTPNGYASSPALPPKSPTSQRRSLSIVKKFRPKTLTKCHPKLIKPSSKFNTLFQCVSPIIDLPEKTHASQEQSATLLTSSAPSLSPSPIFTDNPLHISASNKLREMTRNAQNNDHKDINMTSDEECDDDEVQSVSTLCEDKDPYGRVGSNAAAESYSHNEIVSNYTSRRNSVTSNANSEPQEVAAHHVKFVRDSSKYWYKPNISREEAVNLLRNAHPGTFIVRDSTTFANAFGLVLKVAYPPPGVQQKGPPGDELVRHFLVEPTLRGVRLKGCSNEPVFSSLSALVYQHSITPLALPCRLIIPDRDISQTDFHSPVQQQLLCQGAACNVLYLISVDTESLTGPQAVRKAVSVLFNQRPLPTPTQVHFKVSQQGITLTDNTRRLFFRKNYPAHTISHCGLDPDEHRWSVQALHSDIPVTNHRIYAFVAKRSPTSQDNQCHVFCELEPNQPATAIVSFANKIIISTCEQHTLPKNI